VEEVVTEAFNQVNTKIHHSDIDDTLSGCSAVIMLIIQRDFYIANTGGSRAILATWADDRLRYEPLSFDQTPFRQVLEEKM